MTAPTPQPPHPHEFPDPESCLDRLPEETNEAFEAFRCFLNLGPKRNLPKVALALETSIGSIKRWSATHLWFARLLDYNTQLNRARVRADLALAQDQPAAKARQEYLQQQNNSKAANWFLQNAMHLIDHRIQLDPEKIEFKDLLRMAALSKQLARDVPENIQSDPAWDAIASDVKFAADWVQEQMKLGHTIVPPVAPAQPEGQDPPEKAA